MTIEMNIDYLLKNQISANHFLILKMLLEKQLDRLDAYKEVVGKEDFFKDVVKLQEIGFIIEKEDSFEVTEKCLRTFKGKGYFEEFYAAYPVSTIRPDGKRESLRTARKVCEKRYRSIARSLDAHENIMKCLEFEIKDRSRNDSMKYMKKMPNWLTSEVWKDYEEKMQVSAIIEDLENDTYGTEVI